MTYHVYVDLLGAEGPAVHRSDCRSTVHRKPRTQTTRWYGPFSARQARLVSKREAGRRLPVRDAPRCCGGLQGPILPQAGPWMVPASAHTPGLPVAAPA